LKRGLKKERFSTAVPIIQIAILPCGISRPAKNVQNATHF